MSSKQYHGKLVITLSDGTTKTLSVHKHGNSIYLNDGGHPMSEILIHPSNEATVAGWVKEYKTCRPQFKVIDYEFTQSGQ